MKYINIIISALIFLSLISCEKEDIPSITFSSDKQNYKVNEEVKFTFTGEADTYVIYTGDSSHNYNNSVAVITEGKILDQETTWLSADSLDLVLDVMLTAVERYNKRVPDSLKTDTSLVKEGVSDLVGKQYYSVEEAQYDLLGFIYFMNGYTGVLEDALLHYNIDALYHAPEDGFSKGFPVDREEKNFSYQYAYPGTYKVVAIATNVSEKKYSGSGYKEAREQSADEYNFYRTIREISLTVTE